jgi:hypothetical protein
LFEHLPLAQTGGSLQKIMSKEKNTDEALPKPPQDRMMKPPAPREIPRARTADIIPPAKAKPMAPGGLTR